MRIELTEVGQMDAVKSGQFEVHRSHKVEGLGVMVRVEEAAVESQRRASRRRERGEGAVGKMGQHRRYVLRRGSLWLRLCDANPSQTV
jgi:hypothetical protein